MLPSVSVADPFTEALERTIVLASATAQANANHAQLILEADPEETARMNSATSRMAEILTGKPIEESAEDVEFRKQNGITDPTFLSRAAFGLNYRKDEVRWLFMVRVAQEMLELVSTGANREQKRIFVELILFELRATFRHYLGSFGDALGKVSDPNLRLLAQTVKSLEKKAENGESFEREEMTRVIAQVEKLFLNVSVVADELGTYQDLLEIYFLFSRLEENAACKSNKSKSPTQSSFITPFLERVDAKKENFDRVRKEYERVSPLLALGKISLLDEIYPPELLGKITHAYDSHDSNALVDASFRTFVHVLAYEGRQLLPKAVQGFFLEVKKASFAEPPVVQSKKPLRKKAGKKKKQGKATAQSIKSKRRLEQKEAPAEVQAMSKEGDSEGSSLAKEVVDTTCLEAKSVREASTDPTEEEVLDSDEMDAEEDQLNADFVSSYLGDEIDLDTFFRLEHKKYQLEKSMRFQTSSLESQSHPSSPKKTRIVLSQGAARVFQVGAGLKFKQFQVGNAEFREFLNQVKGGTVRPNGMGGGTAHKFFLPNLTGKGKAVLLHPLHIAHGSENFNPKTLRVFLGRALEQSGFLNNPNVEIILE